MSILLVLQVILKRPLVIDELGHLLLPEPLVHLPELLPVSLVLEPVVDHFHFFVQ